MGHQGDDSEGGRPTAAAAAAGASDAAKPGRVENPHVLPCPLVVFHTTKDGETGRPLGELLRALGYV